MVLSACKNHNGKFMDNKPGKGRQMYLSPSAFIFLGRSSETQASVSELKAASPVLKSLKDR